MTKPLDKEGRLQYYEMLRGEVQRQISECKDVIMKLEGVVDIFDWLEGKEGE
jgi:ferritin-like metal-binding protein YciE